jgi:hypothetical protein
MDCQPTSMRAIRARYDPYEQTRGRVDQLKGLGHSVDKVEIMYVSRYRHILLEVYGAMADWTIQLDGRDIHVHARGLSTQVCGWIA